jgi:hypothetical protein
MSKQKIKEIESELEVLFTELDMPVDWSSKYNPSVLRQDQLLERGVELRNELDKLQTKENENK